MPSPSSRPKGGVSSGIVSALGFLPSRMQWIRFAGEHAIVGSCRRPRCGGRLVATMPRDDDSAGEDGEITWYEMHCLECGGEVAAPNARVLSKSSLRSEHPSGWWAAREARDKEQRQQDADHSA